MPETKLKTGILGLGVDAEMLLSAAASSRWIEVVCVSDSDADICQKLAGEYGCEGFDDYRQLIIQNDLDILIAGLPMCICGEHIKAAMEKHFNILKLPPAARDFEEVAEFVQLAEEQDVKFAVANPSRFAESFIALREFLFGGQQSQNAIKHHGIFLITANCSVSDHKMCPWQSDPKLSGGGILLHNCYELIDQIVWNFSGPEQVYCLNTNKAADSQQRLYLTEDTSVLTMKFSDTCFGNVIASRRAQTAAHRQLLNVYCKDKILTVFDNRFVVSNTDGQIEKELEYDDDEPGRMKKLLENFALSILSPDENKLGSSIRENLANMAVIESAYLSARTGMPEQPGRILEMGSWQRYLPI